LSGKNIEWNYISVQCTEKKTTSQTFWQILPLAYYNYYLLKFEDLRRTMRTSSAKGIVLIKTVSSSVKFRQHCLEDTYNSGVVTYFESENYILVYYLTLQFSLIVPRHETGKKETFELTLSED